MEVMHAVRAACWVWHCASHGDCSLLLSAMILVLSFDEFGTDYGDGMANREFHPHRTHLVRPPFTGIQGSRLDNRFRKRGETNLDRLNFSISHGSSLGKWNSVPTG